MQLDDKVHVELTNDLAWDLLLGVSNQIDYTLAEIFERQDLGRLSGFPNEKWDWNPNIKSLPAHFLHNLYLSVKNRKQ